jgi:glyoxylase I family protein
MALPGLSQFDHVGLTVPDLDAAVKFYTEVIGGKELYRLGPFDAAEIPRMPDGRDWTDAHVDVVGGRVMIAMLQLGPNLLLELLRYEKPVDARKTPPRNCDNGGHHIALKVENIEAATAYLKEKGLRVLDGPTLLPEGPAAGLRFQYCVDPWGNYLELVEFKTLPWMSA